MAGAGNWLVYRTGRWGNIEKPRAAFRAAVEQYPKARIRLRNRALVMEEHRPKANPG
jgi:hypothetical protein